MPSFFESWDLSHFCFIFPQIFLLSPVTAAEHIFTFVTVFSVVLNPCVGSFSALTHAQLTPCIEGILVPVSSLEFFAKFPQPLFLLLISVSICLEKWLLHPWKFPGLGAIWGSEDVPAHGRGWELMIFEVPSYPDHPMVWFTPPQEAKIWKVKSEPFPDLHSPCRCQLPKLGPPPEMGGVAAPGAGSGRGVPWAAGCCGIRNCIYGSFISCLFLYLSLDSHSKFVSLAGFAVWALLETARGDCH